MSKKTSVYRCKECSAEYPKWVGRCNKCGNFGGVEETAIANERESGLKATTKASTPRAPAQTVSQVRSEKTPRRQTTGIGEFDRVLGGGLVPGQVCLIAGSPGSGKSTLLLKAAHNLAEISGETVLYISGEESKHQIALRAHRISATSDRLFIADETDLNRVLGHMQEYMPNLAMVVIDSVQTIASSDVEGRAGGVAQVMEVAHVMTRTAKEHGIPIMLVGQVTKDSNVAGPRALEHIVDTTLSLEGDSHTALRLLRSVKNRFGALEVAAFEQRDEGMEEVIDPSFLFRSEGDETVPGTCITVSTEGSRALIAEIQALVAHTSAPNPRRGFSGLDSARMAMLVAVTERLGRIRLYDKDVFLATVGGHRITDPAVDLAVCLSVASAALEVALPKGIAAVGEVTLSGEIRSVPMLSERVAEANRLGYSPILIPKGSKKRLSGNGKGALTVEVGHLGLAIQATHLRTN